MTARSLMLAAAAAALSIPAAAYAAYALDVQGGGCWMSAVGSLFGCGG